MNKLLLITAIIASIFTSFTPMVSAHPGNTAADGCHYCRTNCAKWGEVEDARHCHGGGTTTSTTNTYVAPVATPNPTPISTPTPIPTPTPTAKPTPALTPTPTATTTPTPTPESSSDVMGALDEADQASDSSKGDGAGVAVGLALLGGGSYGGYQLLKKKKTKRAEKEQENELTSE